jgi:hypothetical protein
MDEEVDSVSQTTDVRVNKKCNARMKGSADAKLDHGWFRITTHAYPWVCNPDSELIAYIRV